MTTPTQPPYHSGQPQMTGRYQVPPPRKRSVLPWVLGCVALVLALVVGGAVLAGITADDAPPVSNTAATQPAGATAAAGKKPAAGTVTDGTWTVGEDIPAGTYKVTEAVTAEQRCYWKISVTGDSTNIVDNAQPDGGRPRVTLEAGQDFQSKRCGTWRRQ